MVIGLIAGSSGDSLTHQLQKKGYMVALICGKEYEPGFETANYKLVCDLSESKKIIDFLSNLKVKKVIFGTGHFKAIELLPLLESSGMQTNLDQSSFNLVKDKIKFKNFLTKHKILTPRYFVFNSTAEFSRQMNNVPLPCVIKSATDAIQPVKVFTLGRLRELVELIISKNSDVLIEEYIDGSDCTVGVTNDGQSLQDYGVIYYCKAKEYELEGFEGANANKLDLHLEEKVRKLSLKLVELVNIQGLVRVDYLVLSGDIYVLEINAIIVTGYTGSAYPFFKEKNIDIAEIMADVSLNVLGE